MPRQSTSGTPVRSAWPAQLLEVSWPQAFLTTWNQTFTICLLLAASISSFPTGTMSEGFVHVTLTLVLTSDDAHLLLRHTTRKQLRLTQGTCKLQMRNWK